MTMKSHKILFALFGVIAIIGATQISHAADNNLLNALGTETPTWSTSITSTGPTDTTVKIQFPLYTSNNEKIMNYSVSYVKGKKIIDADLTEIKKDTFAGEKVVIDGDTATLTLGKLTAESTYEFVVTPINKEGTELTPSDPMSFTTLKAGQAAATTTNTTPDTTANNGNGEQLPAADTAGANFTYTLSGSKVTLKWKSIAGASKFQISMKEATASSYTSIGEEQVSKESYSFVIDKKGQYSVKIVPVDAQGAPAGSEKILTVKVSSVTAVPGKGTPATGAGMNLILMSTFLMMLMYVVYRFRTTK
jgi:hypothetical protein